LLYNGEQVILPEKLHMLDTTAVGAPYGAEGAFLPAQKIRDELKYLTGMTDDEMAYLILGIENQEKIHYAMPVKNMLYDALQYAGQVKEAAASHRKVQDGKGRSSGEYLSGFYKDDRMIPVVTLVVFFSAEPWDGPMSLYDMFSTKDKKILSFVENYQIHLIAPESLSDGDLNKFHSNLKEVLSFIKYSADKQKLRQLVQENRNFAALDRDAAMVIDVCTNSKLKFDENQEVMDMCKAISDIREEGREEGRAQGRTETKKETAVNLHLMGMENDVIAKVLSADIGMVEEWLRDSET
ncbi:MAG: transposase, partial [Lachnospiraceae bacterium]|nr:transposase [Lachnospiraceae bacterium]